MTVLVDNGVEEEVAVGGTECFRGDLRQASRWAVAQVLDGAVMVDGVAELV